VGIVSFRQSLCKPTVNYENAVGFQLLNHAGTLGNYNTRVFQSTEMKEKLMGEIFFQRLNTAAGGY